MYCSRTEVRSFTYFDSASASASSAGASSADIGAEAALSAALRHAGVARSAVRELEYERDWEDGRLVYEIEFFSGETEYDIIVSAADGSILQYEAEADD